MATLKRIAPIFPVRDLSAALVAVAVLAGSGAACGSSSPDSSPIAAFCASADSVLNNGNFASDGGGVIESLRGMDVTDLTGVEQEKVSTAIEVVEANIAAFNSGDAPDGWSTEPVATLATRICGQDMTSFYAVP
jgi:hypothetical protein